MNRMADDWRREQDRKRVAWGNTRGAQTVWGNERDRVRIRNRRRTPLSMAVAFAASVCLTGLILAFAAYHFPEHGRWQAPTPQASAKPPARPQAPTYQSFATIQHAPTSQNIAWSTPNTTPDNHRQTLPRNHYFKPPEACDHLKEHWDLLVACVDRIEAGRE